MFENGLLVKVLIALAVILGLYDAYEIYEGTINFNRHLPFLLPGVFIAFAIMITVARRCVLTPEQYVELQRQDALKKASESLESFEDDRST